jgi:F-type H+-transporting ATPase subunit delta
MAELITLARPYAKAAFEDARAQNALGQWSTMLQWASAVVSDAQVMIALDNPGLTTEQKANIVIDICEGKLSEHGKNFVRILAENKRLSLLPEISCMFEHLKAEQEKTLDVEVLSARALDVQQTNILSESLRKRFDRNIELNCVVDEKLLGGIIIRAGDTVIDGSVRGKLTRMSDAINS